MKGVEAGGHQISGRRPEHSRALYVMRVVLVLRSIEVYPVLVDLFSPLLRIRLAIIISWILTTNIPSSIEDVLVDKY